MVLPLFAMWESLQSLLGCAPFDFVYGHRPRGLLDLVKERWEEGLNRGFRSLEYM